MSRTKGHRKNCNRKSCFACKHVNRARLQRNKTRVEEETDASLEDLAVENYELQFHDHPIFDPEDDEEEPEDQDKPAAPFDGAFF